jgi:hypothetical protein
MSRTYRRRDHVERDCNCGAPIEPKFSFSYKNGKLVIHESVQEEINKSRRFGVPPNRTCRCDTWYPDYKKRNFKRDHKDWGKPDKKYKTVTKKLRRAKERAAMQKHDYDNVPKFPNSDVWDWN